VRWYTLLHRVSSLRCTPLASSAQTTAYRQSVSRRRPHVKLLPLSPSLQSTARMHAPPSCRAELSHSPCARAAIRAVMSVLQSCGYIRTPLHCKLSTLHRPLVRRCAPVTSPVLIQLRPPQRLLLTASPPFLVGTGAPQSPGAASRPSQHPSPTPARHRATAPLVSFRAAITTFTHCKPVLLALSRRCAVGQGPPR
jgi:hypothetical protein